MLRVLAHVRIRIFTEHAARVFEACTWWSLATGIDVELNSAADGVHKQGSLHPLDLAWDLDTVGDKREDLVGLYTWLRVQLPPGFQIVWEEDHVHVEWDMQRRSMVHP